MKKLVTLCLFLFISFQLKAQTVITTGPAYDFLNIATDARHGGTGNAGVASPSDATDFYYNPSKSVFAETKFGIFLSPHSPLLQNFSSDINLRRFGAFYKWDNKNALSANFTYLNAGINTLTNANGQSIGSFKSYEWALGVNFSRKIMPKLSMGIGLRYIKSSILWILPTFSGFTTPDPSNLSADISLYHHNTDESKIIRFDYGFYLSNIGGKVNYGGLANLPMPTNLRFGTGTLIRWGEKHKTVGLVDVNKLLLPSEGILDVYKGYSISIGAEYWYDNIIAIRLGTTGNTKPDFNNSFLTTGLGVRIQNTLALDVAYLFDASESRLAGNLFRANLSVGFGKIKTQNEQK